MASSQSSRNAAQGYYEYKMELRNRIHRVNGYGKEAYTYIPVAIIGAGESGIAMAYKLKQKMGFDQFRIFERQAGLGGTWWINRYPGVACDIPAAFYSFSFSPNPRWTTFFPPGPEIYAYLQDVCDKYGFTDKIELNTTVVETRWMEEEELWEITLQHMVPGTGDLSSKERAKRVQEEGRNSVYISTEKIRAKIVISAVGGCGLVEPKSFPDSVPGFDRFKGEIFHSGRWDYNIDLKDKNVIVVGTGCSAAQFVPMLVKEPFKAKSVTQIMRSPPWVESRMIPPMGDENWRNHSATIFSYVPGALRLVRFGIFCLAEWDFRLFGSGRFNAWQRRVQERRHLKHLRKTAPKKYHEILTPDYELGCKRRIFDATWFPGLHDPRIELTTQKLSGLQEDSVILGPEVYYPKNASPTEPHTVPADVIILANGFENSQWLHPLKVTGKGGKDLIETMMERGGPQAYQGTAMDGFPNMFMIFGPNTTTGHSSVIMATENMVDYTARFVKMILNGDAKTVDVKHEAEVEYTTDIQRQMKNTVWMKGGCSSWYFKDGWNSTVLPYGQIWFWYRCQFPRWNDWNIKYTRKGFIKLLLLRGLQICALSIALYGAYRVRQTGDGVAEGITKVGTELLENSKSLFSVVKETVTQKLRAYM